MFGILRPQRALLASDDRVRHMSAYCSLCGLLGSRYGLSSRMLVVNDIATLWWLLERPSEMEKRPLRIGNCVRGGAAKLRRQGISELHRLLAALSAYTIGIKVADDLADGGGWRARVAKRLYSTSFESARSDLLSIQFPLGQLEEILARQAELERNGESNLAKASEPTAQAYGLVAAEIAVRLESEFSPDQARLAGESLGRAVYLVDAIRDFRRDAHSGDYNPLCLTANGAHGELPHSLRHQALSLIGERLSHGRELAFSTTSYLQNLWHAVERALLSAAGVSDRKSVTLYIGCCFPCGDGAVLLDGGDCDGCGNGLLACCCLCACACFCCRGG